MNVQANSKMPRSTGKKAVYTFTQAQLDARDRRFWETGVESAAEHAKLYLNNVAYPSALAATRLVAILGWILGSYQLNSRLCDGKDETYRLIAASNVERISDLLNNYRVVYIAAHGENSPELAEAIKKINEVIESLAAIAGGGDSRSRINTLAYEWQEWNVKIHP